MPYDPIKDFTPIARVGSFPSFIAVTPDLPVKSIDELVAYAKANPGKINAGYGNSTGRITIETFKRRLNLDITPVAYRSNPAAVTDLMAGHIQMGVPDFSTGLPVLKAGKIRALAVLTKTRDPALPDIPTLDATVMPGYDLLAWTGIFAPAGVPPNIVAALAKPIEKALASAEVRDRFRDAGVEIYWIGPAGFSDYVKTELVKWTTLIKVGGHRAGVIFREKRRTRRVRPRPARALLQLVLHRVETGIHAIVVDARRTGRTDAAHDDIADFDRLTAGNRNHVRQRHLLVGNRSGVEQLLGVFRRGLLERHRRIGLAPRILHRMRRGFVAAHLDDRLAVAIDDNGGYRIGLGGAGGDGGFGDGLGDAERKILVHDERRAGRRGGNGEQA